MSTLTESPLPVAVDSPANDVNSPTPLERVEAELCTLAGQIAAATSRFLCLLAEFDARDGWAGWGVRSCAHWLSWRCGLDLRTGREYVRVARALNELPHTMLTFSQGRLSYSKVRAISRVATPDDEESLVDAALHSPSGQLERLVRALRTAQCGGGEASNRCSSRVSQSGMDTETRHGVQWRWDDDGDLVIWGRIDAEDGARLLAAATRAENERNRADAARTPCPYGSAEPSRKSPAVAGRAPANLAPALVAAAEWICAAVDPPVHAPGAELVVHVQAETLVETARQAGAGTRAADEDGNGALPSGATGAFSRSAHIDDGPALLHSTLQRIACDSRIRLSVHAADGRTLDLGRRRRRPSRALLTALWQRDRGCAMPGCDRHRFLHAHHVVSWAAGGHTDMDNLVLLCGEHHRRLHDGETSIVALGRQRFRFHGPQGAVRPQAPQIRGNADELMRAHAGITPTTIEPDWDGAPLDLAAAVSCYLAAWESKDARN
jgi:HNH endonuclease